MGGCKGGRENLFSKRFPFPPANKQQTIPAYTLKKRSRSALLTTEKDDKAMAVPAIMGESMGPPQTCSSPADSRGSAGREAILSFGRTKSKSETNKALQPGRNDTFKHGVKSIEIFHDVMARKIQNFVLFVSRVVNIQIVVRAAQQNAAFQIVIVFGKIFVRRYDIV